MGRKKIGQKNRVSVFAVVFIILFALGVFASLILAIVTRGHSLEMTMFHPNDSYNKDFFMDFFNSIRDASTMDVYENGIIYPPLANLMFLFFSKFISPEITSTSFYFRYNTQTDQRMIIIYLVFVMICFVFFSLITKYYLKKNLFNGGMAEVFSFIFVMFYPMYYCLERGNIILLAMICTAFFVFFHDSKDKLISDLALIALAVAAGLKIYPALFGLLLLAEKRYRSALKAVIYGVVIFFVPFIFYNHGASLILFIKNVLTFSSSNKAHYQIDSVSIINIFYYLSDKYVAVGKVAFILAELAALVSMFIVPKKWQKYALLSIMLLNIQSVSSSYSMVFMLIPFLAFISDRSKKQPIDILYLILFSLLFVPIPCFYINNPELVESFFALINMQVSYNINQLLALPTIQLLFFCMCVEAISHSIRLKKQGGKLSECFFGKSTEEKATAIAKKKGRKTA